MFNCRLQDKQADVWSHHNYIVYVAEGRKIWHTSYGSFDLRAGSCVFVRKGAAIIEQFFDTEFCFFLFFIPDEFIRDVLSSKTIPISKAGTGFDPIIPVNNSGTVYAYFQSMLAYFDAARRPDQSLLELKFRELILLIADDPNNIELLSYFRSLQKDPHSLSLQRVMEENFCFNLRLEEFAKLGARSLSAFKRDFQRLYKTTPGKWLMEKRLSHANYLLTHQGRSVTDAAFESGFENASHFSRAFRQRFGTSPAFIRQRAAV